MRGLVTNKSRFAVWSVGLLVTGNLVGAGILGLPINTGLSGFLPSSVAVTLVWGLMLGTALIIADQVISSGRADFDLPSLFDSTLGRIGPFIAVPTNLLILYGLLVAYLSGGSSILAHLFQYDGPQWPVTLGLFVVTSGLTLFGVELIRKGNTLLMAIMGVTFIALIVWTLPRIDASRLSFTELPLLPAALPIMVTAFNFHNFTPTVCRSLDQDRSAVIRAILFGVTIGLAMNLAWNLAVMGAIPVADESPNNVLNAFNKGLPATVPLAAIVRSPLFTLCGLVFAIVAITTSYLTNGIALMGFFHDLFRNRFGSATKIFELILAFVPPLLVTILWPGLFLHALDIVGGVGISLLFGILPGVLLFQQAKSIKSRMLGGIIILFFLGVLVFEVAQEMGWLYINPDVELWKAGLNVVPPQP